MEKRTACSILLAAMDFFFIKSKIVSVDGAKRLTFETTNPFHSVAILTQRITCMWETGEVGDWFNQNQEGIRLPSDFFLKVVTIQNEFGNRQAIIFMNINCPE